MIYPPLAAPGPVPGTDNKPVYERDEDMDDWGLSLPRYYEPPDQGISEPDIRIVVQAHYIMIERRGRPWTSYQHISPVSILRLMRIITTHNYKVFRHSNEVKTIFHLEVER